MTAEVVALKAMLAALISEFCDQGRNAQEATEMLEKIRAIATGAISRMNFDASEGFDAEALREDARRTVDGMFSVISFID